MSQNVNIRELSRRLEAEVAAHGCGRESCSLCCDVFDCLAPDVPPNANRPAGALSAGQASGYALVESGPIVVDVQDAIARQELVFADVAGH